MSGGVVCRRGGSLFDVYSGASRAAARSVALRWSRVGREGGVSNTRIASSSLAERKMPATVLPIPVVSLSNSFRSHGWPSPIPSMPYVAVDMETAQATFRASFRGTPLAFMTLARALSRPWPSASRTSKHRHAHLE